MAKKEISRPQTANITPFGLRMQPELKERIEQAATEAGRSMNAEIVARLQQTFEAGFRPEDARFLFAKWNHDLLQAESDKFNLTRQIGELAAAFIVVAEALNGKNKPSTKDLNNWEKAAKEIFAKTRPSLDENLQKTMHKDLSESKQKVMEEAKKHGGVRFIPIGTPSAPEKSESPE